MKTNEKKRPNKGDNTYYDILPIILGEMRNMATLEGLVKDLGLEVVNIESGEGA